MMMRLLISACLLFCARAEAFKVEPMSAEMRPIGKYAQMTMRIDNTSKTPLTIELEPYSMTMDKYGEETIKSADEELLVIPVTAIIQPGRSQTVMVRYLGDPTITESKAYRIAVKQVKVAGRDSNSAQVGLLFQFNTLINVTPENSATKLAIKNISNHESDWLIEVENQGSRYARLSNTQWLLSDGTHNKTLKGRELSELLPGTLVMPFSTRFFRIKPFEDFDIESLSIQILEE